MKPSEVRHAILNQHAELRELLETTRVLDSRGPGEEADFTPSEHCPDWRTRVELHEAGTLWIRAARPKPA